MGGHDTGDLLGASAAQLAHALAARSISATEVVERDQQRHAGRADIAAAPSLSADYGHDYEKTLGYHPGALHGGERSATISWSDGAGRSAVGVRQNARLLSAAEVATLRRAFTAMVALTDDRGYRYHAGVHGLPLPIQCAHGNELFLPWHRAYLYFVERALQDRVPAATLPWWDWTSRAAHTEGIPPAYASPTGEEGAPNPLYDAPVQLAPRDLQQLAANGLIMDPSAPRTYRDPELPDELPRARTVRDILDAPTFLDFSFRLENVHNAVHGWVGGSMSAVPVAAFDPVFWAHHAMIDRLWYLWQLRRPGAEPPATLLNRALPPFAMTVAQTLDIDRLGYGYGVQVRS